MFAYLIIKTLHILSAMLILGTGMGTAFYLFFANRSGSVPAQAVVSYWVCKADFWFTTPAVIFQLVYHKKPPVMLNLSMPIAKFFARILQHFSDMISVDSLILLENGNTADNADFIQLLGRKM